MRIPDHIIEQVRSQANIVDVVGEVVKLRRVGRNYVGLCPFHHEKSPSFNVNPERGLYKCFGCGRAGNVISFVQEQRKLTFVETVKDLAKRLHIVIPEEEVDDPTGAHARRTAAQKANAEALSFFTAHLASAEGVEARAYFTKRGFTDETIAAFGLGYAPDSWDALMNHLRGHGFTDEQIVDAGLVVVREDGRMYDRFRGRATFAIRDDVGRVVGFSARILRDAPDQPKYINTPETIAFVKGRVLYALDRAKTSIRDQRAAILVEGQADVVTLHQAGFTTTVASSGTALTQDHLLLLKRFADKVIFAFDGDNAGQNATTRSIEMALSAGLDVRIVALPPATDPDSMVRMHGAEAFKQMVDDAASFIAWQAQRYLAQGKLDDSVSQAQAVQVMLDWILRVPDTMRHPFYLRELAERFRLSESFLTAQYARRTESGTKQAQSGYSRDASAGQPGERRPAGPGRVAQVTRYQPATAGLVLAPERELFRIALMEEHGLPLLLERYSISEETMVSPSGKRMFRRMIIADSEHPDMRDYVLNDEELTLEERQLLADIVYTTGTPSDQWSKFGIDVPDSPTDTIVAHALIALEIHQLEEEVHTLMRGLQDLVDEDEQRRTLNQIRRLNEERERLRRSVHDAGAL